jgi:uncharacterized protein YaaQ
MTMKLINAIVDLDDRERVNNALVGKGIRATVADIYGSLTQEKKVMFYIAIDEPKVQEVVDIIQKYCKKRQVTKHNSLIFNLVSSETVEIGGATIFISDVQLIRV